jgi:hypothetical protein
VGLTPCETEVDQITVGLCEGVDLRGESAARTAKSLWSRFFWAPLPC